ncbi:MAG: DUF721 domain-containing protein [Prevotellaceae bacterium]|jgi:predicted nucleic acid-binding Zn ribbon protein|nr:DUF721 domain-containing protein [Prevotellaceae bacterium]
MKREEAKSIKDLFPLFIREMGLETGLSQTRVYALWDELMGPVISSATQQKQLKEGKLYVRLSSSVVRNWLFTKRQSIVQKMNANLGKEMVTDIILY